MPFLKEINGQLGLDRNHDHFYQVQDQLLCTGKQSGYFVVYTFKDLKVIEIQRDGAFIQQMVAKLLNFYQSHFRMAVLHNHFYRKYSDHVFY